MKALGLGLSITAGSLLPSGDARGEPQPARCCAPAARDLPLVNANYGNTMHTGVPLHGVHDRPAPQEPRQKTAATQPIPRGALFVPQRPDPRAAPVLRPVPSYLAGCLFTPFWDRTTIVTPGSARGAVCGPRCRSTRARAWCTSGPP